MLDDDRWLVDGALGMEGAVVFIGRAASAGSVGAWDPERTRGDSTAGMQGTEEAPREAAGDGDGGLLHFFFDLLPDPFPILECDLQINVDMTDRWAAAR